MEFVFDTTRTIGSLVASGTLARCPNIKFIFPHAGGAVFMLARRIEAGLSRRLTPQQKAAWMPNGIARRAAEFELRRGERHQRDRDGGGPHHRSDEPPAVRNRPSVPVGEITVDQLGRLGFTPDEMRAIECSNAEALCNLVN